MRSADMMMPSPLLNAFLYLILLISGLGILKVTFMQNRNDMQKQLTLQKGFSIKNRIMRISG